MASLLELRVLGLSKLVAVSVSRMLNIPVTSAVWARGMTGGQK